MKGARVFWCEFDGEIPVSLGDIPEPSIKITSSNEEHQHWYWQLDKLTAPYDLEKVNRAVTYLLGADHSGWDANQVLRPPCTFNHKRQKVVSTLKVTPEIYTANDFDGLPEPPPTITAPIPESLPDIKDVIAKYPMPAELWLLFKKQAHEPDRSTALMALGYGLAELHMLDDEIFTMLLNADDRWEKFKNRSDRHKRLMEIVVRARQKHPLQQSVEDEDTRLVSMGLKTLLAADQELEWVWKGFLQQGGSMLLTGPSGIGKTQWSLDCAAHMALGKPFLGREMHGTHKVGFFSLEMGLVDLKMFLQSQQQAYSPQELDTLEENLRLFPLGEPIYLNREKEKRRIEAAIKDEGLTGVIFDSLGSTTEEELTKEHDVKT